MPEPATGPIAADPFPSSSERSSSSAFQLELKEGAESDEEISRVPVIGGDFAGGGGGTLASGKHRSQGQAAGDGGIRKTGRNTADKESKRLKRLLRNRVSAQQARERKKAYLNDMEIRAKNLEKRNSELEEKLSTLQNENQMLRHILKNTTAGKKSEDGSGDADKINPSSAGGC